MKLPYVTALFLSASMLTTGCASQYQTTRQSRSYGEYERGVIDRNGQRIPDGDRKYYERNRTSSTKKDEGSVKNFRKNARDTNGALREINRGVREGKRFLENLGL